MKQLQILIDRYQAYSDEDRRKILLVGSSVGTLVVVLIVGMAWSSLNSRRTEIKRLQTELRQIDILSDQYRHVKAEQEAREVQIRSNKIALFTLIQNVATRLDLKVNDLNERKEPLTNSDSVQVSVIVTLKQLSIDRLAAFLENIEDSSETGLVKVTRLQVKTRFDTPDLLDVQMTVSTWKAS